MPEEKNIGGRPAKLTFDDKIAVLNRLVVQIGTQATHVLRTRGRFNRLAECAVSMGFLDAKPYDFYNDKRFQDYLKDYLLPLIENKTVQDSDLLGVAYEPLPLGNIVLMPTDKMKKLLEDREIYVRHLYDIAVSSVERYNAVIKENQSLKEQIKRAAEDYERERDKRAEDRKIYEKDMEELNYFRRRYTSDMNDASVNFESAVSPLTAFKPFTSIVSDSAIPRPSKDAATPREKIIEIFTMKENKENENETDSRKE